LTTLFTEIVAVLGCYAAYIP